MPRILQGRWSGEATVVEAFAGSGQYSDGLDGSPVMIAKAYRQHRFHERFHKLDFVTIDKDERRVTVLTERMAALPEDKKFIHAPQEPGPYSERLAFVLEHNAPQGKPTLWIIDPWGLKDIAWRDVSACATRKKNEVIVTLMLDEVHRYLGNPAMEDVLTQLFGDVSWQTLNPQALVADSKEAIKHLYRQRLESLGCLTGAFDVQARGQTGRYALIFGTHHKSGLECWNDACWSLDETAGKGSSAQMSFSFGPDVDGLRDYIESLQGSTVTFSDLHRWSISHGYKETHLRTALGQLSAEGIVMRVHPVEEAKSPWPSDSVIQVFSSGDGN
jgi:three-Cys-motif partner protein